VRRWDGGDFEWVERDEYRILVRLAGAKLKGALRLERQQGDDWTAVFMSTGC
jgi:hypothetical protein